MSFSSSRAFAVLVSAVFLGTAFTRSAAFAWGPHTEITRAALDSLSNRDQWQKYFGSDWDRLARDYCWMGDWREAVRPDHYVDDYLLFPGMPSHLSHMHPEVRRTYEPYFRRALQALRTESPQNAARWLGSLVHFVQDSGSPPHTIGVGGTLHANMERWVDETKIRLNGYRPRLLGKTDEEALRGFLERMDELTAFAKWRALQLKPLVDGREERINQPLELECTLETARVTADVVHTLLTLGQKAPLRPGGALFGRLDYRATADCSRIPAKVMLTGTPYSTTADTDGNFRFRNLPPGRYEVWILATGWETECIKDVVVRVGEETCLDRKLKPDRVPGNRVRNPSLWLRWLMTDRPEGWTSDPVRGNRWASALIRVPVGLKCTIGVEFQTGQSATVSARWRTDPSQPRSGQEVVLALKEKEGGKRTAELEVPDHLQPFEKGVLFLEVLIETPQALSLVCRHVFVVIGAR